MTAHAYSPIIDMNYRSLKSCVRLANGFIMIEYSVGDPDLFIEGIFSQEAFDDFCAIYGLEANFSDMAEDTGRGAFDYMPSQVRLTASGAMTGGETQEQAN